MRWLESRRIVRSVSLIDIVFRGPSDWTSISLCHRSLIAGMMFEHALWPLCTVPAEEREDDERMNDD
jgi:hypothetical protein